MGVLCRSLLLIHIYSEPVLFLLHKLVFFRFQLYLFLVSTSWASYYFFLFFFLMSSEPVSLSVFPSVLLVSFLQLIRNICLVSCLCTVAEWWSCIYQLCVCRRRELNRTQILDFLVAWISSYWFLFLVLFLSPSVFVFFSHQMFIKYIKVSTLLFLSEVIMGWNKNTFIFCILKWASRVSSLMHVDNKQVKHAQTVKAWQFY